MDNERHAIETAHNSAPKPPAGYALAFNGEQIKKSCETCSFLFDDSGEYASRPWWACNWNNGNNGMGNLMYFPFKNGCKHFELHHTYTVDWETEALRMEEDRKICKHLSSGYCLKNFNSDCPEAIDVAGAGHKACEKAL